MPDQDVTLSQSRAEYHHIDCHDKDPNLDLPELHIANATFLALKRDLDRHFEQIEALQKEDEELKETVAELLRAQEPQEERLETFATAARLADVVSWIELHQASKDRSH